ncbi:MAG: hypothetical protein AAF587_44930 [Bacteroidota bacterium]
MLHSFAIQAMLYLVGVEWHPVVLLDNGYFPILRVSVRSPLTVFHRIDLKLAPLPNIAIV